MSSALTSKDPALLAGRYRVVGQLATGGMAEILLGKLTGPAGFERAVVIKRILPHFASQASFVRMFLDEARIVAQIRHPNVVQVNELNSELGDLFLVQEYLEGESAAGLLRRLTRIDRRLPCGLAAWIVAEACAGLHAAHELVDRDGNELGVVHRDISPENIFVTYAGTTKVLDFGIALARGRLAQTETGHLKGKFGYMSPEQCADKILDARSDLFALGIVLHELISGRRLFGRSNALATIQAICERPIPLISAFRDDAPAALSAICERALARNPDDRYQTAAQLRSDLLAVIRTIGPSDPTAELSKLMTSLFAERIEEKRLMLAQLADDEQSLALPSTEVDSDIELLVADTVVSTNRRRTPPARWPRALLATVALAIGIGGFFGWRSFHARSQPPSAIVAPATVPPAPIQLPAAEVHDVAPPTVTLRFTSNPPGAHVLLNGRAQGDTPCVISMPHSSTPLHASIRHAGFASVERDVTPLESVALDFSLTKTHTNTHESHPPPPVREGFHKF